MLLRVDFKWLDDGYNTNDADIIYYSSVHDVLPNELYYSGWKRKIHNTKKSIYALKCKTYIQKICIAIGKIFKTFTNRSIKQKSPHRRHCEWKLKIREERSAKDFIIKLIIAKMGRIMIGKWLQMEKRQQFYQGTMIQHFFYIFFRRNFFGESKKARRN